MNSERSLRVTVDLSETYPTMEAQGPVPELLRKVLNAYDMVNKQVVKLQLFIVWFPKGGWMTVRIRSSPSVLLCLFPAVLCGWAEASKLSPDWGKRHIVDTTDSSVVTS